MYVYSDTQFSPWSRSRKTLKINTAAAFDPKYVDDARVRAHRPFTRALSLSLSAQAAKSITDATFSDYLGETGHVIDSRTAVFRWFVVERPMRIARLSSLDDTGWKGLKTIQSIGRLHVLSSDGYFNGPVADHVQLLNARRWLKDVVVVTDFNRTNIRRIVHIVHQPSKIRLRPEWMSSRVQTCNPVRTFKSFRF